VTFFHILLCIVYASLYIYLTCTAIRHFKRLLHYRKLLKDPRNARALLAVQEYLDQHWDRINMGLHLQWLSGVIFAGVTILVLGSQVLFWLMIPVVWANMVFGYTYIITVIRYRYTRPV
jgi:tryptophan-rich sensory protein